MWRTVFPTIPCAINLRPSILDDLGLVATLSWFVREFGSIYRDIEVNVELLATESDVLEAYRLPVFRVVQEAMNNVAKHSKANQVIVALRKTDQTIQLVVRDNGHGFMVEDTLFRKRARRGLGLDSMKERIELSGGSFTIKSSDSGTGIQASWPLS